MTHIEYSPAGQEVSHTLKDQLEQIKLIRSVEKALDDKRKRLGVFVERKPWPDMQDVDFALQSDTSWSGQHARLVLPVDGAD